MSETNENKCLLAGKCKKAGDPHQCNNMCYPYIRLHGETGKGGILGASGLPKAYRKSLLSNLPFKDDNPKAFRVLNVFIKDIVNQVDKGSGLYLHGIPNDENPKGCGNGKTTASGAILNEYIIARVILEAKKERKVNDVPALFVNISKFQNTYNGMFRGTNEMKEKSAEKYYNLKGRMRTVPLLIMDDIGVRDSTEAFMNEFYEVIDDRANEELSTIYTSNVPLAKLGQILDDRIASRIEGSSLTVPFFGADKRKSRGI